LSGNNIAGAVSYDGTTDIATFTPSGTLDYHKLYTVTINSGAQDMAGNSLSLHTWSFTTEAAPFIDLIVDSISLSSHNVMQGGTLDVTLQISNTGIWPASSIWYELRLSTDGTIDFYDNYLTSGNIANLAQGSNSGTLIKTITIPSIGTGDYYIGVIVDPNSNILETNESNNTKYDNTKITITENPNKPDLVVDSISLSSYNIIQGGTLDVTLQISNIGNLNSNSNYFTIYMSADGIIDISDTYVADGSFSNLSPGSSTGSIVQTITIPGNPGTGDFYIGVIVDPWNDIAESNETNNSNLDGSNLTINFNPNLWKIATFACNPDNNINTIVALYASDGMTLIWYDWDTSDGPYGKIFYGLSSGTYYVVVYNTFNPGIGCYYLKVTQGAIPTSGVSTKSDDTGDIFPDQSSADMAGAIILNTDTIHYDNDTTGGEDWFKIVIP
jgi:hypothetical protein